MSAGDIVGASVVALIGSIKGEFKKKHLCDGRSFSCFAAHVMEQGLF